MALWEILEKPWNRELKAWSPIFRTPFTDIAGLTGFHSSAVCNESSRCPDYETKFTDCMEAYGPHRGIKECRMYYEDLIECAQSHRQRMRVDLMQAERKRQYKAGERAERYAPPPKMDAY